MSIEPSSEEPRIPTEPTSAPFNDAPTQHQWAPPGVPTWGQAAAPFGAPPQPQFQPQFQPQPDLQAGPVPPPPPGYPPSPYSQYPGYGGPMYPGPPMPPKKNRGWIGWVVSLVVVALVLAGVYAIQSGGHDNPVQVGLGSTPSSGSTASEPAGEPGSGQPGPGACDDQDLTSCLLATPSGAQTFSSTWDNTLTPTVAQYVQQNFTAGNDVQIATQNLNDDGVQALAHTVWGATGAVDQIDIMLFRFGDARGAQAWALDREGSYMASFASGTSINVPGDSTAKGYSESSLDSSGYINTHYAQAVGDIAVVIRYSSESQIRPGDFQLWTGDQLARLKAGPAATASPSAAPSMPSLPSFAPSSGCVAATGGSPSVSALENCLMATPSGASPDTSTTYDTTENPTIAQYVDEYWSDETSDQQSAEVNLLEQSGLQNVAHRRWVSDSDQVSGDAVLLGYTTAPQAQGRALAESGVDMGGTEDCDSPGLPDAHCMQHSKDGNGYIWIQVIAWHGPVEMKMEVNCPDTANLKDALTWAQTELEELGPAAG